MPAALAGAKRSGHELVYDEDALTARLRLEGPAAADDGPPEPYLITADFEDYRVLPPIWRFVDPRTGNEIGTAAYPQPTTTSVLHPNGLICAHWSRLAYAAVGGPHSNWGGPETWRSPSEGTIALTIPDMLARLAHEVAASRGRMAALPPL